MGKISPVSAKYTIATLGSHSALQILKGAHDEGFKTFEEAIKGDRSKYIDFFMSMPYVVRTKNVRDMNARKVLTFISANYQTLPFSVRWIHKEFGNTGLFALPMFL